ncbi:MAG: amidohydrolase family protein [Fidelibacterota bacterium]|nr:MAG: amidohydrolase family protein [Candidatus Neomarinimicrobiota bacterium]
MRRHTTFRFTLTCIAALALMGCAKEQMDFAALRKIDAHFHVRHAGPEALAQAAADNFRVVSPMVDHGDSEDLLRQWKFSTQQLQHHPEQFAYLTAFPIEGWDDPDWQENTLSYLKQEFENGAIGVKVWKNIGMVFQDQHGAFVMIDDPKFDPIIDFIEAEGKTLTGHIGEPRDCWLPLEEMVATSNRNYFSRNPEYHMYLHPEYPAYEDHIQAVSRMLEKHPELRYVGCHLASIEWSVAELGKFLDRFPNAAVDMAARIDDLQNQDRDAVRAFFIDYQDRLLYGTDEGIGEDDDAASTRRCHEVWMQDWTWLATDSVMTIPRVEHPVPGLGLPAKVLEKVYRLNAEKWYPEI